MSAYKCPKLVEFVDSLPKSPPGKIVWRALQEQEWAKGRGHRMYRACATPCSWGHRVGKSDAMPSRSCSGGDMHQLLAVVHALEHALECLYSIFQSLGDGFPVLEIATGHLLGQQCRDLLVLVLPLGDQEETVLRRILQLAEDMEGGFHLARVLGIVGRDVATDRHPRAGVQQPGHGTADVTADVLEVHINAVRTGRRQIGLEVARLVIDTGIKAQLLDHE